MNANRHKHSIISKAQELGFFYCGFSKAGLPIGLQLLGKPFGEPDLLRAAHAYEQATDWHTHRPNLD